MKKIIVLLVAVVCFALNSFGQNTANQTNGTTKSETHDTCAYRIAGICTSEDIGGVEVSRSGRSGDRWCSLEFENYNSFTVSVIYEFETEREKKTGVIVLRASEKKKTNEIYFLPDNYKLIARKLKN